MRFGAPERPHEDRPLRAGNRTASVLIAFHVLPDADVEEVVTEVEDIVRELLDDWYESRGHRLLQAVPDLA